MIRVLFIMGFGLLLGCSTVTQRAETQTFGTNTVRVTTLRVTSLGDAKQVIQSLQASNGSTQRLGAAGLEQETQSQILANVVAAAITAAKGVK